MNLLVIIVISYLFLYKLATYHWKGLKENYNFVVTKHFNQNLNAKVMITQSFKHICSPRQHGCSPSELLPRGPTMCSREHGLSCFLREYGCSPRELLPRGPTMCPRKHGLNCFLREYGCSPREHGLSCFLGEYGCS